MCPPTYHVIAPTERFFVPTDQPVALSSASSAGTVVPVIRAVRSPLRNPVMYFHAVSFRYDRVFHSVPMPSSMMYCNVLSFLNQMLPDCSLPPPKNVAPSGISSAVRLFFVTSHRIWTE